MLAGVESLVELPEDVVALAGGDGRSLVLYILVMQTYTCYHTGHGGTDTESLHFIIITQLLAPTMRHVLALSCADLGGD